MFKRGLSTVITSVILVLLVLVSTTIVWVVVRNVIDDNLDNVAVGATFVDLKIKNIQILPNDDISITIKRGVDTGGAEVTKIKVALSDGINSEIFDIDLTTTPINELSTTTITLTPTTVGIPNSISLAPIFLTEKQKEITGNVAENIELTREDVIEMIEFDLEIISHWKLDGTSNDAVGGNHGTWIAGTATYATGIIGQAADFDADSYISAPISNLDLTNDFTVTAWIKLDDVLGTFPSQGFVGKTNPANYGLFKQGVSTRSSVWTNNPTGLHIAATTHTILPDTWYFLTLTYSNNNLMHYLKGDNIAEESSLTTTGTINIDGTEFYIGRFTSSLDTTRGLIDEVMVFNQALTPAQIQSLYNIDNNQ